VLVASNPQTASFPRPPVLFASAVTTSGAYFQRLIDEVRIYNGALSQTESQADMNTPIPGAEARPPS
jgi:hypothetical protein